MTSKLYLASPLGFAESTVAFLSTLNELIERAGIYVLDPWKQPSHIEGSKRVTEDTLWNDLEKLRRSNWEVARTNERWIRESDVVLAVLDGTDVDSGTASEIGFAYGIE